MKQCRSVLERDPNFERAWGVMMSSYLELGKYDEAIDGINRWADRDQGLFMWAWRAAVFGRSGHAEEARRALARLEQLSDSRSDATAPLLIAYLGTGQKERVIELLQKAYSEHSNAVVQSK